MACQSGSRQGRRPRQWHKASAEHRACSRQQIFHLLRPLGAISLCQNDTLTSERVVTACRSDDTATCRNNTVWHSILLPLSHMTMVDDTDPAVTCRQVLRRTP
ncbi:hypothetical protein H2Y56_06180 [Pectobacterium aroidearum]|uniref:Uncharacterized protein n=1 Tax=Pectobacterium aroidearum TaxID=1201031 RepID=A0ABR5ZAU3_9GAMM|nr:MULTISPECIES: hypothetical protein [Pectobacterium]MBA5198913.1 hypothetical protein [Pectobacterium aroidearum]MBA5230124.1 hypothetical protein [Pectobacterium aroidearum]MBA5231705.1 hypothetical protein [Pectobacterium aroidearum]MBA5739251.1 hypothetical protein [Pectobacterium aroidearum]UXJ99849.1 hypothetical protein N5056_19105 [Pectobacterium aroidearum]